MRNQDCCLIGIPVQAGTNIDGCLMGPDAFRTAGLSSTLEALGHSVFDYGNLSARKSSVKKHSNEAIHHLDEIVGWASSIEEVAYESASKSQFPVFLGGDHSLSIGTVPGVTRAAREKGQEQFVLWLDAHPDFHTLDSTKSGNLHGTPVAYFAGLSGFEGVYPDTKATVPPQNICMMGIRSVDEVEKRGLADYDVRVFDMRSIDENGIVDPLKDF